jgi:hypothetical protein
VGVVSGFALLVFFWSVMIALGVYVAYRAGDDEL